MVLTLHEEDREQLRRLEEDLWKAATRFDIPYMEQLLADDFMEFGRSGRVYEREDTLAVPRQPIDVVLPLADFRVRLISPDVAQVTYDSEMVYDGEVQHGHRSSIWARAGSGWVLKFHQGTPFEPGA